MKLMPDEKILMESDNKELILTTHRLRYEKKGDQVIKSIMLEELQASEITSTSEKKWLTWAIYIFVATTILAIFSKVIFSKYLFGIGAGEIFSVGLLIVLFCIITYWWSRQNILSFTSGGISIKVPIRGKLKQAEEFLDEVEIAKNMRSSKAFRISSKVVGDEDLEKRET